jgi:hypothetical protein
LAQGLALEESPGLNVASGAGVKALPAFWQAPSANVEEWNLSRRSLICAALCLRLLGGSLVRRPLGSLGSHEPGLRCSL